MQYSDFETKLQPCRGKNILLGFSGGADSCALFLILEYWRGKIPFDLTAVHFEHGLRGEASLNDAAFCRMMAEKYNVDFLQFSLNVPRNILKNETMESAARRLRLAKWYEITAGMNDFEIHLAHHSDDLAENVLLRIFRGANVSGLCGLREFSILNKMPVRRILLQNSRSDIEKFLSAQQFTSYCTDHTNLDCSIGRNFLRNKILRDIEQNFPYAVKGIVQSANVCEIDADFIENAAQNEFEKIRQMPEISNNFWLGLHPALRTRVLRMYLSQHLQSDYVPSKNLIDRFNESLSVQNSRFEYKIEIDSNIFYTRINDFWQITDAEMTIPEDITWDVHAQNEINFGDYRYHASIVDKLTSDCGNFYFDIDELQLPLQITTRREGDAFEKFGGGSSTVKAELTNHKVHGQERSRTGILRDMSGQILLIGDFRRSSFAPVCRKNAKILQITVEKSKK